MTALTITHTHEEGTLIEGTTRGDGSAEVLKAHRWRWGRSIGAWYVPRSRDQNAQTYRIRTTAEALEAAGFSVAVQVDDTARAAAEVEADKAARAEDRAAALAAKAERKAAAAASAAAAHQQAADRLPEGGEPIKVGHHSEARHRRDIDRAHSTMGKAVEADRAAAAASSRAETASAATGARYAPSTVSNRIDRLQAQARKIDRSLNGYIADRGTPYAENIPPASGAVREHYQAEAERVADQLTYWQRVRAAQIESGEVIEYTRETISKGDYVRVGRNGGWWQVRRANPKTLTLESMECSIKAPYGTITGHQPAGETRQGKQ